MLFGLAAIVFFLRSVLCRSVYDRWLLLASLTLMVTSKTQHYPLGVILTAFHLWKGNLLATQRWFGPLAAAILGAATAVQRRQCARGLRRPGRLHRGLQSDPAGFPTHRSRYGGSSPQTLRPPVHRHPRLSGRSRPQRSGFKERYLKDTPLLASWLVLASAPAASHPGRQCSLVGSRPPTSPARGTSTRAPAYPLLRRARLLQFGAAPRPVTSKVMADVIWRGPCCWRQPRSPSLPREGEHFPWESPAAWPCFAPSI